MLHGCKYFSMLAFIPGAEAKHVDEANKGAGLTTGLFAASGHIGRWLTASRKIGSRVNTVNPKKESQNHKRYLKEKATWYLGTVARSHLNTCLYFPNFNFP
jgi:hypothetical protein